MQDKKGSFLKERFLFSSGFVLFEALFCLMLSSIALSIFAFYVSLPKHSIESQNFSSSFENVSTQSMDLRSSSNLVFKVNRMRLKQGENFYTSFQPLQ